jgi:CRP-like cAMP-binding protein
MLGPQDWALLNEHVKPVAYRRGHVILEEGGHRRALHIVNSGTVRVEQAQNGRGIALALLGPGEIFGEMGFVENAPASASVVAQDDCVIDVIEGEALQSVMASEAGFAVRFYHSIAITLIRRLRVTSRQLAQAGPGEVAQVNPFRVTRTGNISARQVPPELSAGLDGFERTMLSAKQELRAGTLSEAEATRRVAATCDQVVRLLDQFTKSDPLVEMGWSDLLAFRDSSQLEAGVGDYVFRETFPTMMLSATMARCYAKPRGFPDDHETITAIYANQPEGDDRLGPLIDHWFLGRPISRSRRASRDLMLATLRQAIKQWPAGEPIKIAGLASGVAAELLDLCAAPDAASVNASCVDIDSHALLATARRAERSGLSDRITLIQGNAVPSAGEGVALQPQQIVYALGLCEYITDEQVVSLLDRTFDVLVNKGSVIITNLAASSPDRELMEHVLDWKANHRTAEELRSLFARSRFGQRPVDIFADETDVTLFVRCSKTA